MTTDLTTPHCSGLEQRGISPKADAALDTLPPERSIHSQAALHLGFSVECFRLVKRMTSLVAATLTLVFPANLQATAQKSERLKYEGKTMPMFSTPLEDYFSEQNPRPNGILSSTSTANHRGYVGDWKIQNERLILTGLYRQEPITDKDGNNKLSEEEIPASKVFGNDANYPIEADWFSGQLRIPQGEMVRYVHMGFGSQYEKELYLEIKDGEVVQETEVIYDGEHDSYRSQSDMRWVALGGEEFEESDEGDWIDGRLLRTPMIQPYVENSVTFKTRGIFSTEEGLASLWIPDTPKTEPASLPLNRVTKIENAEGSHVEVAAHFYKMDEGYGLEAESIRLLVPGETIHHPNFPEIWNKFLDQTNGEASKGEKGE